MNYYYSIDGADVIGPHTLAELKNLHGSGAFPSSTRVCLEGEQNWRPVLSILDAPPVPTVPPNDWYYSQNGRRIGPVTFDAISDLITTQALTRDTPVWQEGMADWTPASGTALNGLFGAVKTPPPLMGESVNNRIVWILAFAPIIGVLLAQVIAFAIGYPENEFPFIVILLNVGLSIADEKQLKKDGHNTKGMGFWVILVPVYLFVRARRLRQKNSYAIVWIVAFIISLFI
jgi:hypothetical protein